MPKTSKRLTLDDDRNLSTEKDKLAETERELHEARARLAKLRDGKPATPSLVQRAKGYLAGGTTALAEATVNVAEIEEFEDRVKLLEVAQRIQAEHVAAAKAVAVRNVVSSREPEYRAVVQRMLDAIADAVEACDAAPAFVRDLRAELSCTDGEIRLPRFAAPFQVAQLKAAHSNLVGFTRDFLSA